MLLVHSTDFASIFALLRKFHASSKTTTFTTPAITTITTKTAVELKVFQQLTQQQQLLMEDLIELLVSSASSCVPLSKLACYFEEYFARPLVVSNYGCSDLMQLVSLMSRHLQVSSCGLLNGAFFSKLFRTPYESTHEPFTAHGRASLLCGHSDSRNADQTPFLHPGGTPSTSSLSTSLPH